MVAIKNSLPRRRFDVVIVGAGGSGMRASLQLARAGLSVCVLSKVKPSGSPGLLLIRIAGNSMTSP